MSRLYTSPMGYGSVGSCARWDVYLDYEFQVEHPHYVNSAPEAPLQPPPFELWLRTTVLPIDRIAWLAWNVYGVEASVAGIAAYRGGIVRL